MNRYLFVIDYQKDFVDGALGFPGAEKLDAGIAAKVRTYGPGRVIFTRDTHFENYLQTREGRLLPVVHCIKGTPMGISTFSNVCHLQEQRFFAVSFFQIICFAFWGLASHRSLE